MALKDRAARLAADRARARLDYELGQLRERLRIMGHPAEILVAGDEGDRAAQSERRDVAEDELGRVLDRGRRLYAAAARLDAGEYGACQDCGNEIAPARLKAIPEAERCVACQETFERRAGEDVPPRPRAVGTMLADPEAVPVRKGGRR